jgi:hypothetical protein
MSLLHCSGIQKAIVLKDLDRTIPQFVRRYAVKRTARALAMFTLYSIMRDCKKLT